MADKSSERVLVVPTAVFHELGLFQGFRAAAAELLPRLLEPRHVSYRPRRHENDPPSSRSSVRRAALRRSAFHYTRERGTESAAGRADRSAGTSPPTPDSSKPLPRGDVREVAEEFTWSKYEERCIGLINDDATQWARCISASCTSSS